MQSVTSNDWVAIANERCPSIPERVDAFALASSGRGVVLVTVGHRRVDIARELVRKLVDRMENAAPTHDAFAYGPPFFDQVVSNPDDIDVLIAVFADMRVTLVSSPGLRCFRLRAGQLTLVTSSVPGIVRTEHELAGGDAFLLCSEGVYTMVSEKTIGATLRDLTPREAAWSLVEAGRCAGPHSDVTAIVVRPDAREGRAA